jgi:hypothetical protein
MNILLMLIPTLLVLAATIYAHYRLPFHVGSLAGLWMARLLLVFTGVAFGAVSAGSYMPTMEFQWVIGFVTGFGLVHVPAAAILFLKRMRALGR